jgi:hypothetical protein
MSEWAPLYGAAILVAAYGFGHNAWQIIAMISIGLAVGILLFT